MHIHMPTAHCTCLEDGRFMIVPCFNGFQWYIYSIRYHPFCGKPHTVILEVQQKHSNPELHVHRICPPPQTQQTFIAW